LAPDPDGQHFPGRWVEQGSAQAVSFRNTGYYSLEAIKRMQDHIDLGH
jgi:hypothetical protein